MVFDIALNNKTT